ncbi:MAG TPA: hypothetical protein VHF89_03895 [Solirubrobacteraceae bacterium]|nr:hypothetical protein [Solirubrobacteraceae bacterium]
MPSRHGAAMRSEEAGGSLRPLSSDADARILRALAHPVRLHAAYLLTGEPMSADRLAALLGRPQGEVVEHLRVLEDCSAVEKAIDPQEPERYRSIIRPILNDDEWERLPASLRREMFGSLLQQIAEHVDTALASGGFDRPDAHVSWTTMRLDAAAYRRVVDLLAETLERAMAIQAEAEQRQRDDAATEDDLGTEIVLLHFLRDRDTIAPPAPVRHGTAPDSADEAVARMYSLAEDIADELPQAKPDWKRLAECALELGGLARQRMDAAAAG